VGGCDRSLRRRGLLMQGWYVVYPAGCVLPAAGNLDLSGSLIVCGPRYDRSLAE
jgi:hypothetical protein